MIPTTGKSFENIHAVRWSVPEIWYNLRCNYPIKSMNLTDTNYHWKAFFKSTSHIMNIPHLEHPTSRTSHIPNIPHPEHPTSWTSHIPNIPHPEHPTSLTSHIRNIHILNILHPQHPTSPICHFPSISHSEYATSCQTNHRTRINWNKEQHFNTEISNWK